MLFLEQNALQGKRKSLTCTPETLQDLIKEHFPKLKYIETGKIETTFYPVNYNYHVYLTHRLKKNSKPIVFGRLLATESIELENINIL